MVIYFFRVSSVPLPSPPFLRNTASCGRSRKGRVSLRSSTALGGAGFSLPVAKVPVVLGECISSSGDSALTERWSHTHRLLETELLNPKKLSLSFRISLRLLCASLLCLFIAGFSRGCPGHTREGELGALRGGTGRGRGVVEPSERSWGSVPVSWLL